MKAIITGDSDKLSRLIKELRLRFKRDGLTITYKEGSLDVKEVNETKEDTKPHWKITVSEVEKVETLEDLKPFESDERKTVIKAVELKKIELDTI